MTDDNSSNNLVDMDDLDKFSDTFFGRETANEEEKVEESNEEVEEIEDDALETSEDQDASEAEDEGSEDEQPEEEEEEAPPPKKAKKSAKERIDEITAEKYELKRQLEALQAQLSARSNEVEKTEDVKPAAPVREQLAEDAPNPDAKDAEGNPMYPLGEFDPKFIRDITRYSVAQEMRAAKEAAEKEAVARQQAEAQQKLAESWNEKLTKYEEEVPEVRDNIKTLVTTFQGIDEGYGNYIAGTIMQLDNGPQIMDYLSQNIGEAQRIVASGPVAATLAIGKLDAMFTKAPVEKKSNKKVSDAPEPPKERARGSNGQFTVPPDTDDLDAFEKVFYKRER
jgi:chemotaxis protein histidine kinase CheA